jgi:membrane protease YdiL (CAAX protease family)
MALNATIKRHPAASFIVLALGLSYATFALPVAGESALLAILSVLVIIPTAVAVVLTALVDGRRGVGAFVRQCFQWRCAVKWYFIAIALGFVIHLGSSVLALLTGAIPALEIPAPSAAIVIIPIASLLEEIGWRGFALRRLLDRYPPFAATLLIGIPWALLHVVLFVLFEPTVSALAEGLIVFAFALPLTWIFVKSGGNVLVATVLHSSLNAFAFLGSSIPPADVLWYVLASSCLVVAFLLVIDRSMWFARPAATKVDAVVPSAV